MCVCVCVCVCKGFSRVDISTFSYVSMASILLIYSCFFSFFILWYFVCHFCLCACVFAHVYGFLDASLYMSACLFVSLWIGANNN